MMSICKTALLLLLRVYKCAISPLFLPACRFVPTCSEYAAEAVSLYGPVRGIALAIWRLMRCHPFARGGYDPAIVRGNSASVSRCSAAIQTCRH
jgi:uncharacterized protein